MTYEVRLARRAVLDLRNLYGEKRAKTSHYAATWFIGLEAAIFGLENTRERGAPTPEDASLRHFLYGKKPHVYRIIYSINEQLHRVNVVQFAMVPASLSQSSRLLFESSISPAALPLPPKFAPLPHRATPSSHMPR